MNRTEARIKWEQMTGADQAEALRKMCIYCRKYAAGKGQFWAAWIRTEDDLQTASAEAWIEMEIRQADSGVNFEKALYTACAVAIKREYRGREKAWRGVELDAEHGDQDSENSGSFADWLIENAADRTTVYRAEITDPFEIAAAAEIREQIAGDGADKIIISGLLNRANLTEIAEQLKISKQAVSKRLAKIRNRAAAAIG